MSICPHLSDIRIPTVGSSLIHKEECTQCFASDNAVDGINVCLTCFNGGCSISEYNHSEQHSRVSSHPIVLKIMKREKNTAEKEESNDNNNSVQPQKITKLAINMPGGLQDSDMADNKSNYIYETELYCFKCKMNLKEDSTPELKKSVEAVLSFNSASKPTEADGGTGWEDEILNGCDHTKNLVQDANLPKYNAATMTKCTVDACDKTKALWFCLTCGYLGCPRVQHGDANSGNGHAKQHYEQTKHPLVLKIGTIKPDGTGDVYCYADDNSVKNENLAKHLAHFGINIADQEATEKSTAEINLEWNMNYDWSKVFDEEGKDSVLMYGPYYTGLANLGNSCYIASVVQVLFTLPFFQQRYITEGKEHLLTCRNNRPADCFQCQMAKIGQALSNGKYSPQPTQEQLKQYEAEVKQNELEKERAKLVAAGGEDNKMETDIQEKENRKRKKPVR